MRNRFICRQVISGLVMSLIFGLCTVCFGQEESITITTYYPSPYGSYNELQTNRLYIGGPSQNTDPLWIERVDVGDDRSEFRIGIGDNTGGDDSFVIGVVPDNSGVWTPIFTVRNDGYISIGTPARQGATLHGNQAHTHVNWGVDSVTGEAGKNHSYCTVSGGGRNTASGYGSIVSGGYLNTASGEYSWAGGRRAEAEHEGSFVWADAQDADYKSNGNHTFNVRAKGGVFHSGDSPEWDIAEEMEVLEEENIQACELVSIGGDDFLVRSRSAYDKNLIGVVASKKTTTLHLQSLAPPREKMTKKYISLVGRAYVKVNREGGEISPGEPITSSSSPGVGMKATKSGRIIGFALEGEDFKEKEVSEILVFVNVGDYINPEEYVKREDFDSLLKELKTLKERLDLISFERIKNKGRIEG